jgi:hypothetical protein
MKDLWHGKEWLVWQDDKGQTFRKHMESGNTWIMNRKGDWVPYKSPEEIARKILNDMKDQHLGIYKSPFI